MLRETIHRLQPLTDAEYAQFLDRTQRKSYPKREVLLRVGEVCRGIYFVEAGVVGLYHEVDGKEVYQDFFLETEFATDTASLSSQTPARRALVAIEPVSVVYCSRVALLELYAVSPNFREFGRKLLETLLVAQGDQTATYLTLDARARYAHLLRERPEWIQRIPLQYLATYLGMARETLSRLRRG